MARADIEKIDAGTGERLVGWQTVYGYQSQVWIGRRRLHIFWRGDPGEAFHDHPWSFTTFPLTSYVEEFLAEDGTISRVLVRAFRFHHREATYRHRILGAWDGLPGENPNIREGAIITLVRRGHVEREWFYLRVVNGKVRSFPWKAYLRRIDNKPAMKQDGEANHG